MNPKGSGPTCRASLSAAKCGERCMIACTPGELQLGLPSVGYNKVFSYRGVVD